MSSERGSDDRAFLPAHGSRYLHGRGFLVLICKADAGSNQFRSVIQMVMGRTKLIWTAIILCAIVSIAVFWWVESSSSFKVTVPTEGEAAKPYEQAIKALDSIADVGIKLATTLVGVGAAVFLGFKTGLILTTRIRILLLLATACFLQSALYAVLWRMSVAELWINNTLDLLSAPRLQYRFEAHFLFFLAGLACLGVLIVTAALAAQEPDPGETS
jgi:hypothetical protein